MDMQKAKMRAKELVAQMTVEEKASQLLYNSPAIERLGIHEYNWWNEASHGVARAGTATVFPHAIAMAATFDPQLLREIGEVVSTEARAKYNHNVKQNDRDIYKGLTFWAPNINIFRDPRWGRGQETFGEDPCLTAILGSEYVRGIQGEGEFLKAAACAKHFAVHSGPEGKRHGFDARVNAHDLWETYLAAFEWLVREAKVAGVMGAYNRLNGVPCCCSEELLKEILVDKWGFDGYVVSDCGALRDISEGHHYTHSDAESAALAIKNGCQLNCGWAYEKLIDAWEMDLIEEADLTAAAEKLFTIRYLLGEFEQERPFRDIHYKKVDCAAHKQKNLEAARECMVLLENREGFLPVDPKKISSIAVVGPNSMSVTALEGNYNGYASRYITVADGIREVFPDADISVSKGSQLWYESKNEWNGFANLLSDGVAAAEGADLTVLCLGLDSTIEGEEMPATPDAYTDGGDKKTLFLPKTQQRLAEAVCQVCENVVVVLMSGGALDLGEKLRSRVKAVIQAWYPGAVGGLAVAELIAGRYSPSGKLPVTFYRGDKELPDFSDYSMAGRTYRYCADGILYPFGYGLSYTAFALRDLQVAGTETGWEAKVTVSNEGSVSGKEKLQAYVSCTDSRTVTPICQLCSLTSVELEPGEAKTVTLSIPDFWVKVVLPDGSRVQPEGKTVLYVGTQQPDPRSEELTGRSCLKTVLQ